MSDPAYIIDSLGQKWELVEFFDHEGQQWLCALRFVSEAKENE